MSERKSSETESQAKDSAESLLNEAAADLKIGHFAAARTLLDRSNKASGSDEKSITEKRASLWAKLSPDPLVAWLIAGCVLLYVSLIATFVN